MVFEDGYAQHQRTALDQMVKSIEDVCIRIVDWCKIGREREYKWKWMCGTEWY